MSTYFGEANLENKGHFNHYFYSFHKANTFTPMDLNECMNVQGTCYPSIANLSGFDL